MFVCSPLRPFFLAQSAWLSWMNDYVERLIGTIRRACTDRLLVFSDQHLRRTLAEYGEHFNHA